MDNEIAALLNACRAIENIAPELREPALGYLYDRYVRQPRRDREENRKRFEAIRRAAEAATLKASDER